MDFVLEAAQHDQVDKAAIPALLSQVTATNTEVLVKTLKTSFLTSASG